MDPLEISETELDGLSRISRMRTTMPSKFPILEEHKETIVKAIERDISLPVLLEWLIQNRDLVVSLNTLRKFVTKTIGQEKYDDYLKRNHWERNRAQGYPARKKSQGDKRSSSTSVHQERATEIGTTLHATRPAGMTEQAWIADQAKRSKPKT